MTKTKIEEWKRRKTKGERTYRPSVGRERITHDIRITGHYTLLSKAINGLIDSRSPLLQFPTLEFMTNMEEKKRRRKEIKHTPEHQGKA